MKILFIHDFNPFLIGGGVEINTRYLIAEIQGMGHEVALGYQDQFGSGPISGLNTIPLGNMKSIVKTFNEFDHVILLGSMSLRPLFLIGSQILTQQKRKFIIYFRSSSLHRPFSERFKHIIDLEIDRLDAEMCDVIASPYSIVLANSSAMKNDLQKMYSQSNSKYVYIVYPGTIWPMISITKKEKLQQNKFVFITVGRLTIDKGLILLLEAFYHLHNELIRSNYSKIVELKIIGSGDLEKTLRFLIDEFKLSHSVFLCGKIQHEKVFEHMSTSHALVHPALLEPFGNVIVEALGMGLPVIASDFDGPKEILNNGKHGILIPRFNTWHLKETMKEIVVNDKFYGELLNKAKESHVRNIYSVSNQAKSIVNIINKEAK